MKHSHIITLMLGDWSGDGHGISKSVNISSNLPDTEITKAYRDGKKKFSFDFDKVCEDYEDSHLTKKQWDEFVKLGFRDLEYEAKYPDDPYCPGDVYDPDDPESDFILDADGFAALYLFIAKLGNDSFEYEILDYKQNPTIDIGGYGLFSR